MTINCSIKEGLALTSYESLSMGVPVISSDVGGQAELINEQVGKIVKCLQKETDIHNFEYTNTEIDLYIKAIEEIIQNIEYYKNNCRNRILEKFTLNNMAKEMTQIFTDTIKNPNIKKIENAKTLSNSIDMLKELICINLINDTGKIIYESELYQKAVYGSIYTNSNYNYKFELLKEKLWKYPIWRAFVKTAKKMLKRN